MSGEFGARLLEVLELGAWSLELRAWGLGLGETVDVLNYCVLRLAACGLGAMFRV